MIKNKFPITVVVQGKNPYVCSQVDSPRNPNAWGRRSGVFCFGTCWESWTPSEIRSEEEDEEEDDERWVTKRPWVWPQRSRIARKRVKGVGRVMDWGYRITIGILEAEGVGMVIRNMAAQLWLPMKGEMQYKRTQRWVYLSGCDWRQGISAIFVGTEQGSERDWG